jgi:hypothetical protein
MKKRVDFEANTLNARFQKLKYIIIEHDGIEPIDDEVYVVVSILN